MIILITFALAASRHRGVVQKWKLPRSDQIPEVRLDINEATVLIKKSAKLAELLSSIEGTEASGRFRKFSGLGRG